ncbi:MAG: hypothetical protein O3C10_08735 [Chloroflexi bacterium]|nr:hypothetical protein [Chloroflexota bacterium]
MESQGRRVLVGAQAHAGCSKSLNSYVIDLERSTNAFMPSDLPLLK